MQRVRARARLRGRHERAVDRSEGGAWPSSADVALVSCANGVDADGLGRDGRWSGVLLFDRARQLRELPGRPVRPREHGAGGLEHGARASARGHARRDRRADRPARRARRSVPRAARAAVARVAVAARRSRSRRSLVVALGALPVFWLGRRHLGSERGCRAARDRLPRVPVDGHERGRRDPSGDVRDPALPLLHLVPRHRAARAVRVFARARDVDGRADGAPDRRPRHLVRPRARQACAPERAIAAARVRVDVRGRLRRRARTSRARAASSSGSTTRSADRRSVS